LKSDGLVTQMCGRYTLNMEAKLIAQRFGVRNIKIATPESYNVAPSQVVAGVICQASPETGEVERVITGFKWGFEIQPSSAKGIKQLINARAETLTERAMFKKLTATNRCIIPANAFYEWAKTTLGSIPYAIRVGEGELFGMAGLWQSYSDPDDEVDKSCVIVTVSANSKLASLHDRMPAILTPESEKIWLDPGVNDIETLLSVLVPLADDRINFYRVSSMVNSVKFDGSQLLDPLPETEPEEPKAQPRKNLKVAEDPSVQLTLFD
jgi:putative SOS response-associated peptidase YedK